MHGSACGPRNPEKTLYSWGKVRILQRFSAMAWSTSNAEAKQNVTQTRIRRWDTRQVVGSRVQAQFARMDCTDFSQGGAFSFVRPAP